MGACYPHDVVQRSDPNRPARPWLEALIFFVLWALSGLVTAGIVRPGMSGIGKLIFYLLITVFVASCYFFISALYYAFRVDQAEPPNAEPTRLDIEEHRGRHAEVFGWRRDEPHETGDEL